MTATLIQSPNQVILRNISWKTYQSLVADFEQEPAVRLTYDDGTLEIRMPFRMSLGPHESYKKLIGRLIEAATEELGLEIRSLGSRTCDREDLAKGLEPDQCYYIQNEPTVRGIHQIDLNQLPPPDLALEIDITSSSLDRFSIYQTLGVPEIWRFDGSHLTIHILRSEKYEIAEKSIALAPLGIHDFLPYLVITARSERLMGENAIIREFRQAIRKGL